MKPLSEHCELAAGPVGGAEPLATSRACPGFSDVVAEVERASERASSAECKAGRVVRLWGSFGETSHYFDTCDRLVGLETTSDTKAACNKTSFTISFGRTELEGRAVAERLASASGGSVVGSGEAEFVAAAAASGAVSLSACPAPPRNGSPAPANVHVTATFANDGRVVAVRVDAASPGLPTACVQSSVRVARIPAFAGSPITLPTSYVLH